MKISVLGAGSWGLTLAWLFAGCDSAACEQTNAPAERQVWLWDRKPEKIQALSANRSMEFPVPITLQPHIVLNDNLADTIDGADIVVLVVTTDGTRTTLKNMVATGKLSPNTILVNASKGIESPGLIPLSEVFAQETPDNPFAVLSGPTLAKEILNGLPTAAAIASKDIHVAEKLQQELGRENLLRLYSNTDVLGVELGGALKNVFAIASGFMVGQNLGENARAALITRGLVEMTRLSVALGAEEQSLYGLSGLGDLLATCNSPLSRNYQVGYQLAQGKPLEEILAGMRVVAEGVGTTRAVSQLSEKLGMDCPVVKIVEYNLSGHQVDPNTLIRSLMTRKLKSETGSKSGGTSSQPQLIR